MKNMRQSMGMNMDADNYTNISSKVVFLNHNRGIGTWKIHT